MIEQPDIELLKRYPRAIYHLRSQLDARKLMPVLGAGVSQPIGIPGWVELVDRIAEHPGVDAAEVLTGRASQTSRVQLIFHHFRRKQAEAAEAASGSPGPETTFFERKAGSEWRDIVQKCLYATALDVSQHPYLKEFLGVVRRAPLTVNYNFDDTLQDLLDLYPDGNNDEERGFETVWEPTVQFRYRSSVIYHPNGFLPRKMQRGPSPRLVFLEDSFADQMIDTQRGHYSTLLSHLYRFTSLLMGLSLEDATLKHLLRQSAQASPGHIHYYVAYCAEEHPAADRQYAVRESNFKTYNLVTLFLNERELGSLGRLLSLSETEFAVAVDEAQLPTSYVYYLSGAVGSGKTTSLGAFKSLNSYDEWLEEKPALLHQAANTLTPPQKLEVDEWIDKQMRRRNLVIHRANYRVTIVDRSPLDPVAFAGPKGRERAARLKALYQASSAKAPCPGMIIVLCGNPEVMHGRTVERHKDATVEYVRKLQDRFVRLWGDAGAGEEIIDTVDVPPSDVVQRISRVIHLGEYRPVDLAHVAEALCSGDDVEKDS